MIMITKIYLNGFEVLTDKLISYKVKLFILYLHLYQEGHKLTLNPSETGVDVYV